MSLPFPFSSKDGTTNAVDQYLTPDERWDIYSVKAAQRPHLLPNHRNNQKKDCDESTINESCAFCNVGNGIETATTPAAKEKQELISTTAKLCSDENISSQVPPLLDGCDIAEWRSEGLVFKSSFPNSYSSIKKMLPSSDCHALFNIGSENAANYLKRSSQWPIAPSYYWINQINYNKRNECRFSNIKYPVSDTSIWRKMYDELSRPGDNEFNCMYVDYDECCKRELGHETSNKKENQSFFAKNFEEKNYPAKILNATRGWKAMETKSNAKYTLYNNENCSENECFGKESKIEDNTSQNEYGELSISDGWQFHELQKRFGNVRWRFSDLHGEMMELKTYQKYVATEGSYDDAPLGIYDSEFGDDEPTKVLLQEYNVPACFSPDLFDLALMETNSANNDDTTKVLTPIKRPPFRWILIGPPRSGTGLHIDPLWTNAWVTLIQGTKRWILFPPSTPPEEIGFISDQPQIPSSIWFRDYYFKNRDKIKKYNPVEVLQKRGETVFVPNGWIHLVLNLDFSVAVTHNYACEFGPSTLENIWKQVVIDEPNFALSWYNGLKKRRPDLAKRIHDFHMTKKEEKEFWAETSKVPN